MNRKGFRRSILTLGTAIGAVGCAGGDITGAAAPEIVSVQPTMAVSSSGLSITADLVPFTHAGIRLIPNYLSLGNTTIPNYLGSVQSIDGYFYTMSPTIRIAKYRGAYFLIPSDAKFGLDKYGYFCGRNHGWGSGNDAKTPLRDGGVDLACRTHDQGWAGSPSPQRVLQADQVFLSKLMSIGPRWTYERDYRTAAIAWMTCRVQNRISTTTSTRCLLTAAGIGSLSLSTLVR